MFTNLLMKKIIASLFFISPIFSFGSNNIIDSLYALLKSGNRDSNKVNTLNALGWQLRNSNVDTSLILSASALKICQEINWEFGKGRSYNQLGAFNQIKGNYPVALDFYGKALKIREAIKDIKGVSNTLRNIGLIHWNQGDHTHALDFYFRALKLKEQLKDKIGIANTLTDIGIVYEEQRDYTKALEYYFNAMKMQNEIGNKYGISILLANIGIVYWNQKNYGKALDFDLKAIELAKDLGDKNGLAAGYGNIGIVYNSIGALDKALGYYLKALALDKEQGNKGGVARHLSNIGSLYFDRKNYKEAELCFQNAFKVSDSIGALQYKMDLENHFSELYSQTGNYKLATEHYKKYIVARDSISNEKNTKKQTQTEMQYVFDKQQVSDSIKNAEAAKQEVFKHDQEIKQQKLYTYGGAIGFLLMIIVAGVSFRAFKQKQKANTIISHQKELVEEKQKEILDSIHYAKRIQRSLLPTEKYIEKTLQRLNA